MYFDYIAIDDMSGGEEHAAAAKIKAGVKGGIVIDTDEPKDLNGDGMITADDCPYPLGSAKAQQWWQQVMQPYVKSKITDDMTEQYGDRVVGAYKGKALVPGERGAGQGDFDYFVDKLRVTRGLSIDAATRIAGKVASKVPWK